jgi:alkylation response protein AidB-like acyl-CoA dehydrogenase
MNLTSEQKMLQDTVRKFVKSELEPIAQDIEESGEFPAEIVGKLAEIGLLAILVPDQYGGVAFDTLSFALSLSEISRTSSSTALILLNHNAKVTVPIARFGTEEQKTTYLPRLSEGTLLGAFALLEPESGSDYTGISTTASMDGDSYVLNGKKFLVINGTHAGLFVIVARTAAEGGNDGLSAFLVERDTEGLRVGSTRPMIAMNASGSCDLELKDCRVPASTLLGGENGAETLILETMDLVNIGLAAQALGLCEASLKASLDYSKERVQFGRPISEFEMVQEMLAGIATRTEATRHLILWAAARRDEGAGYRKEAALTKLFATDAAMWATTHAVQVFGGYGYVKDYPVERFMRDAKAIQVFELPNEHLSPIIARELLE